MDNDEVRLETQALISKLYNTAAQLSRGEMGSYFETQRKAYNELAHNIEVAAAKFRLRLHE